MKPGLWRSTARQPDLRTMTTPSVASLPRPSSFRQFELLGALAFLTLGSDKTYIITNLSTP
jgi:hypothetical protein